MNPVSGSSAETSWSLTQKIFFRFSFIFFGLYIFPFPANYLPVFKSNLDWVSESWDWLIADAGKYIFHLPYEITPILNGSGDTTWNWIQIFIIVCSAFSGMLIWSIVDRHRKNYERLLYWFTVCIRYYLAFMLITYGSFKVFKSQFPAPNVYRLSETYGQSSPMGLAWTFLGFSNGFNYFMGFAEVIGGLLLLIRKTKTLGALFCMTVTANIVAINYCFDVPVKIFSSMLFLMAVFIAAPDFHRLTRFFILNGDSRLKYSSWSIKSKKWQIVLLLVKTIFIFSVLYTYTMQAVEYKNKYGDETKKPALYGSYRIETFYKDSVVIPPLLTNKTRWNKIILSSFDRGAIQMMNDTLQTYIYQVNPDTNEIRFKDMASDELKYTFKYLQTEKDCIEMKSEDPDGSIYLKLVRLDPGDNLLMKRGFHWINEYPLNR
jgi:uncharacterized membrane protein YphA (DoxX/SURF4 family)